MLPPWASPVKLWLKLCCGELVKSCAYIWAKAMKGAPFPGLMPMWTSPTMQVRTWRARWRMSPVPVHLWNQLRDRWKSKAEGQKKIPPLLQLKAVEACGLGVSAQGWPTIPPLNWTSLSPHQQSWTATWKSRADCVCLAGPQNSKRKEGGRSWTWASVSVKANNSCSGCIKTRLPSTPHALVPLVLFYISFPSCLFSAQCFLCLPFHLQCSTQE